MRYLHLTAAKKIAKIGPGTWQFGSREWGYGEPYAEQEAHAIVRRALELGVTLFDTAEIYSEPFPSWLCPADLQYVDGLGELTGAPGAAAELPENSPRLELGVRALAG